MRGIYMGLSIGPIWRLVADILCASGPKWDASKRIGPRGQGQPLQAQSKPKTVLSLDTCAGGEPGADQDSGRTYKGGSTPPLVQLLRGVDPPLVQLLRGVDRGQLQLLRGVDPPHAIATRITGGQPPFAFAFIF